MSRTKLKNVDVSRGSRISGAALESVRTGGVPADTLAFAASLTVDTEDAGAKRVVLTGNVTTLTLANPVDGREVTLVLTQDATGSRTLAWGAAVLGGPVLTTTASKTDVVTLLYVAAISKWVVKAAVLNQ